jgi:hypothetical protein
VDALPRAPGAESAGAKPPPYLPVLGVLPLRFQEPTPPPDLVTRPPAAAPPQPALSSTENSVAADNAAALARSTPVVPPPAPEVAPAPVANKTPAETPAPPAKTPPAILPDEAHPAVRPEDFLPYFQIPGSAKQPGDVTLLVPAAPAAPAPATIPPSSATYTQTPK